MNLRSILARAAGHAGAVSLGLAASAIAQTGRPAAPTGVQDFSTRTDIVLADVTVIDGKGQPVVDLGIDDFTLSVNGRTRPIQAVQYVSSSTPRPSAGGSVELGRAGVESRDGRYLLIVADESHLSFGASRAVLRAAENLIDRLAPEDRVGVVRLPTGGGIEFTRDHARAIQGLRAVTGRATRRPRLSATIFPSEAVEMEEGGGPGWEAAITRECGTRPTTQCVDAMQLEALSMLNELRAETAITLRSLEQLLRNIQSNVRLNVVLISEGLFLDRNSPSMSGIASLAAAARVSMNIVRPATNWYDASTTTTSSRSSEDDRLVRQGLEQLAGELRGGYYTAIGDGSIAFDRIGAELAGYYLLAFEPTNEDRTGRERRIRVEVKRRGVTLRSRSTFVVPSPSAVATRETEPAVGRGSSTPAPADELPSSPLASVNAAPLRVGTYSMFNADDQRVRVLISAEVGDAVTEPTSWRASLMLKDQAGKIVSNSAATVSLSPTRSTEPSPALFSTELVLEPGDYSFTLALVGSDGRVGMAEEKLAARFRPAPGGFSVSDLVVVSEPEAGAAMRLTPSALVSRDRAAAFLEVQHADAKVLGDAKATFEVAQSEEGPSIVTVGATSDARANGTQRVFAGSMALSLLPPGDYFMRATLTGPGGARHQIARTFRLDRGIPAPTGGSRDGRASGPPLIRAAAAVPSFALQQVLSPATVRAFIDELEQRHPSSPALRSMVDDARAARFPDQATTKTLLASNSAMGSFLAGLAELQAKRLTQATTHFRQTLRAAPDFVGVAFYLGACYAADGRDREAIGAWQMSLLSKGADAVYPAIVDAMLRLGESKKALELLGEAPQAWPNAAVRMRREAIARATLGEDDAALPLLVTLLDGSTQDADLLFLGIQVMYRAYVSRGLNEADRAKFGNWARQYESLGGPESALVRTWRDHVGR